MKIARGIASISLSLSLLLATVPVVTFAQTTPSTNVDQAVYNSSMAPLVNLYNKVQSGIAVSADYQSTATALKIMFSEWEASGLNKTLQQNFNQAAPVALANFGNYSSSAISALQRQVVSLGASITTTQIQNLAYATTRSQFQTAIARYSTTGGVELMEAEIVQSLLAKASAAPAVITSKLQGRTAHLALTDAAACDAASLVGIYAFGITLGCPVCGAVTFWVGGVALIVGAVEC